MRFRFESHKSSCSLEYAVAGNMVDHILISDSG